MTRTPSPLSPDDDRDFQQLTGHFDRPVAPSPAFAERLRQRTFNAGNKEREITMDHIAPRPMNAVNTPSQHLIPMPNADRSGGRFLEIAAASVLVIALLGSMFMMNHLENGPSTPPPHPGGQRLAAVTSPATPESSTSHEDLGSRGGVFGTASDLNATYPDFALPDGPLAPTWSQEIAAPLWMNPYGDVVAALGMSELTVYDASSGDALWSQPVTEVLKDRLSDDPGNPSIGLALQGVGTVALPWIDEGTLYVTTATELVGLDVMNGKETFRTPHLSGSIGSRGTHLFPTRLTIDNGVAYLLSSQHSSGQTWFTAIDLSTGKIVWQTPKDSSTPFGYLIVSANHLIYIIDDQDDNRIVALNVADGSLAWETEDVIYDDALRGHDGVALFVTDGVIVESRGTTSPTASSETPAPEDALRLAAYDLQSGDVLWTSRSDDASWELDADDIDGCGFYPRVSGDSVIVPCGETGSIIMTLVSIPLRGNGQAETVTHLDVSSATPTTGFIAAESAWVYGQGDRIVRLDLSNGETQRIGTMSGVVCVQRSLPTDDGFVCLTTDGIGTYTIQAIGHAEDATPIASPISSPAPGP